MSCPASVHRAVGRNAIATCLARLRSLSDQPTHILVRDEELAEGVLPVQRFAQRQSGRLGAQRSHTDRIEGYSARAALVLES